MVDKMKLAINGGEPIRKTSLPLPYLGASILGQEEILLLTEVINNKAPFREYGIGSPHMVKDFEKLCREYFNVNYALGTSSGTASLLCALAGLDIGPRDEVILPAFGWLSDFNVLLALGATPVFAEIDSTLCIDIKDFEQKITERTKAVIVIHFQGASNDMNSLINVAKRHNVKVVEDNAQAFGGNYKGQKLGALGDVSCSSFQQNKVISTGDGGVLLTNDPDVFERAVRFHDLGFIRPSLAAQLPYEPKMKQFAGLQFRMNEFTGAVALAQLRKLENEIVGVTRKYFKRIQKELLEKCPDMILRPTGDDEGNCGIAFYMDLITEQRATWFNNALEKEGIRIGPSSGCCNLLAFEYVQDRCQIHPDLPPFGKNMTAENVEYHIDMCPNTDKIVNRMSCVAVSPAYTDDDVTDIIKAIVKVWENRPATF
jgi:8-amino-3,8-dideoxy-alpha-D-manno-octulosonate transaminase